MITITITTMSGTYVCVFVCDIEFLVLFIKNIYIYSTRVGLLNVMKEWVFRHLHPKHFLELTKNKGASAGVAPLVT